MPSTLDATAEILERTPAVVDALLRGTSPSWHRLDEGPGTWSPFDVVGHLVHADETNWIPRARTILEHGEDRPLDPFDRFGQLARFGDWTLDDLLNRFAAGRRTRPLCDESRRASAIVIPKEAPRRSTPISRVSCADRGIYFQPARAWSANPRLSGIFHSARRCA